ncbi:MAG TPA: type II toxin-antitoxin system HicA family toxin [Candidatus Absconditabacterales bacterium]|nr:type II toxin-antitoxin system HicA family toxin [Candidatus Absconditabacterales bacterium]HPK27684.1 type II toxin-antitoxin system HicA family toxin [Candidatus Absconditabacterales bacterium]
MTRKDRFREDFLNNPQIVKLNNLIAFLEGEGYKLRKPSGGSHYKLVHLESGTSIPLPIHNGEVKDVYKSMIKKFYLKNLQQGLKKQ